MADLRLDVATLFQIGIPLAALAVAWGNNSARLDAQASALKDLQAAILAERSERLAEQASQAQARMAWLLARSGQRLDPAISDVVKSASQAR